MLEMRTSKTQSMSDVKECRHTSKRYSLVRWYQVRKQKIGKWRTRVEKETQCWVGSYVQVQKKGCTIARIKIELDFTKHKCEAELEKLAKKPRPTTNKLKSCVLMCLIKNRLPNALICKCEIHGTWKRNFIFASLRSFTRMQCTHEVYIHVHVWIEGL